MKFNYEPNHQSYDPGTYGDYTPIAWIANTLIHHVDPDEPGTTLCGLTYEGHDTPPSILTVFHGEEAIGLCASPCLMCQHMAAKLQELKALKA